MISQLIVFSAHEQEKYAEKIQPVKNEGLVLDVAINCFTEIDGMFGPVHVRTLVMADVVAVVPALMVVFVVDTGDAVVVRVTGIGRIHKAML